MMVPEVPIWERNQTLKAGNRTEEEEEEEEPVDLNMLMKAPYSFMSVKQLQKFRVIRARNPITGCCLATRKIGGNPTEP
jgi:hypothetical protein